MASTKEVTDQNALPYILRDRHPHNVAVWHHAGAGFYDMWNGWYAEHPFTGRIHGPFVWKENARDWIAIERHSR